MEMNDEAIIITVALIIIGIVACYSAEILLKCQPCQNQTEYSVLTPTQQVSKQISQEHYCPYGVKVDNQGYVGCVSNSNNSTKQIVWAILFYDPDSKPNSSMAFNLYPTFEEATNNYNTLNNPSKRLFRCNTTDMGNGEYRIIFNDDECIRVN
jgi:hypothetical protein